jgi:hypothetical protein
MRAPLLVIDGDSFAHRAYHALPKTIRRRGNKGAGAILGFANYLLRFYESCCVGTARSKMPSRQDASLPRLRCCASTDPSRPWIDRHLCRLCAAGDPAGQRPRRSPAIGSSRNWRSGWKGWPSPRETPAAVHEPVSFAPGPRGLLRAISLSKCDGGDAGLRYVSRFTHRVTISNPRTAQPL